ncbi:hypothetical protein Tco_0212940 [Tanacetum coccineum]
MEVVMTKERISAALVIGTCHVDKGSTAHDVRHCENSKKECGEFSQGGHEEGVNDVFKDIGSNKGSKDDVAESVCSGHFKKSVNPRTGGSILNLMEELVKVGQTMGYNMDGCMNNMTEIIESQGVKEGFR